MRTPPAHRATSAHLQAAYPFVTGTERVGSGPVVGRDLLGAAFCFDPWERYGAGELTGPNMLVVGQIGRGKSSFVKTFVWRELAFGRRAWVIDPKGEYSALAEACGSPTVRLQPGGAARLNPLDVVGAGAAPAGRPDAGRHGSRRGAELLASVASASLGRSLLPEERAALDLAVRWACAGQPGTSLTPGDRSAAPTVGAVIGWLLEPAPEAAAEVSTDVAGLAAAGRQVALELRRLVEGDLAGMFDGPTTVGLDLDAPMVVLDLSALYRSPALGIVMICASAWLHSALAAGDGIKRLVVVDEAWAVLHDLATARWLQASFKLARSLGAAHIAVLHRLSDLQAAGAAGSEQQQLAEGLLADAETRVVFAQPPSERDAARDLLGLSSAEEDLLPQLPRGVAIWKVGDRSTLVRHRPHGVEWSLIDTDGAMLERRGVDAAGGPA
ncbi:hypothetical protein K6U06_21460 [Acidiferrimicrobium sp. IK]|uniref:VirB4 family type IV secretion system protein n=1 Tax=Acidiferrimicrobium sp. IK TaxID=2871700 RepID=UPI0021CAE548|nr:hypothetical protein [Acidiferrimicrobium sp. IK]MCU4186948.1 hypothetical protein [Acidiferrimicrobium sp. IK]